MPLRPLPATPAAPLLLLCLAAASVCGCSRQPAAPPDPNAKYHIALVDEFAGYTSSPNGKFDVQQLKTKKYLFVYFAAHWSERSIPFTAKLLGFYNEVSQNGDNDIGVIFVPLDTNQYDANTFMQDTAMPWLCVRVNTPGSMEMRKRYEGKSVPCLVLLDENDKILSSSYNADGKYLSARPISAYEKLKTPPRSKTKKTKGKAETPQ